MLDHNLWIWTVLLPIYASKTADMSCDDKQHLTRLIIPVSLRELVQQIVKIQLETGADCVTTLVTVYRYIVYNEKTIRVLTK